MANKPNRWLNYVGLELLWSRIKKRYDKKLDSVESHDNTIRVVSGREIAVKVSNAENNAIQTKEDGLYVSSIPTLHKLTFGAGGEYVYDGSKDVTVPVYDGSYEIH
jgi:hypothetical protein